MKDRIWYFLEKDGICVSKHKVLVSARLRRMQELRKGVCSDSLKIVDSNGVSYE